MSDKLISLSRRHDQLNFDWDGNYLTINTLLTAEWQEAVRRDYNHPCVVAWVPVNESMGFPGIGQQHVGQYAFIERMVKVTRRLDSTRPVIDNDGWEHTDITDICAIHDYTPHRRSIAGTLP